MTKDTQTPSKSALPHSQKTDTHTSEKHTPKHATSRELFSIIDSATSNKEEIQDQKAKSELDKCIDNIRI